MLLRSTRETPQFCHTVLIEEQLEDAARRELRVIRVDLQVSKQQRLAARPMASTIRFHSHKDGVDLFERFCVVKLHDPPFLRCAVLEKDSEIQSLLHVRTAPAPGLERPCVPYASLLVQIVCVEDQRFPLVVEYASAGLLGRAVPP